MPRDPAYYALSERISAEEKYFEDKLSPEDRERFGRLADLHQDCSTHYLYSHFAYGFQLGAKFMMEILAEELPPG